MNKPYNPHPNWREHFAFKPVYPPVQSKLEFEPILPNPAFVPDPVLQRFKFNSEKL